MSGAKTWKYTGRFRVRFPKSKFESRDVDTRKLVLHQAAREHDQAVLTIRSKSLDWYRTLYSGTPVQIDWSGSTTGAGRFVGYVTHVRPYTRSANNDFEYEVVCISASWDLRKTGRKTWKNKTAPEIVQSIGKEFGFKVVTKKHALRRPQTVLSGESYWSFLHKLGERIGYALRVDQTTIYFLPVSTMVANNLSSAPYLSVSDLNSGPDWDTATIRSFTAWGGDTNECDEYSADSVAITAIDPQNGRVYTERKDPKSALKKQRKTKPRFTRFPEGTVAHSRQEAALLSQGRADNGAMSLDGRMSCIGDGSISPYKPVYLSLFQRGLSGYWIVKSVVHTVNGVDGEYTIEAVVSTDMLGKGDLPKRKRRKVRDLEEEARGGWEPSRKVTSRLKSSTPGMVNGLTLDGKTASRWVAV